MTSEEIKAAMYNFSPVIYDGIRYKRITAYIFRVVALRGRNAYKTVLQVELLDYNENSVTIADANKIKLVENKGE